MISSYKTLFSAWISASFRAGSSQRWCRTGAWSVFLCSVLFCFVLSSFLMCSTTFWVLTSLISAKYQDGIPKRGKFWALWGVPLALKFGVWLFWLRHLWRFNFRRRQPSVKMILRSMLVVVVDFVPASWKELSCTWFVFEVRKKGTAEPIWDKISSLPNSHLLLPRFWPSFAGSFSLFFLVYIAGRLATLQSPDLSLSLSSLLCCSEYVHLFVHAHTYIRTTLKSTSPTALQPASLSTMFLLSPKNKDKILVFLPSVISSKKPNNNLSEKHPSNQTISRIQ